MRNCSHPACDCVLDQSKMVERDEKLYCNEACARQDMEEPVGCACGHAQCGG